MDNANILLLLYGFLAVLIGGSEANVSGVQKLFVFGDSYADTGNLGKLDRSLTRCWYEPYGMSFPRKPTGRFSDGKVLSDFIASFIGIRSPVPYKFRRRVSSDLLKYGMNFAVSGTGVFDLGNFQRNLSAQVDTFQGQINESVYTKYDIQSSIALVTISGNDYHQLFDKNCTRNEILDYIKNVTDNLKLELKRIHNLGVNKVLVTNLTPLGCAPLVTRKYNYKGCDKTKGLAVEGHNMNLNAAVYQLNAKKNSISSDFVVLDLHSAFLSIINQEKGARKFNHIFRPCCEGKLESFSCGQVNDEGVEQYSLCRDPSEYLYWDSVHPSQAGWDAVFQQIKPFLYKTLEEELRF
ncbi:GDSL esterase/lipase At5g03610-like [Asparagus officinalis]|uniref:GDSL esterase/lipase At5g03610-like n=1 Tax=Asparagus officinalis TaxID=4686 RepID=UPI00098E64C4|nr:GDSL esterase/lipase At5g03610-like [Asparagus officinalis]